MVKRLTVRDLKFSHVVAAEVKTFFEKSFWRRAKMCEGRLSNLRTVHVLLNDCLRMERFRSQSLISNYRELSPTGGAEE